MNILKKYKNNKKYNKLTFISILLASLLCFATIPNAINLMDNVFYLKISEIKLKSISEDLLFAEMTLKDNPNLSMEELVVDYKGTIKIKNELTEDIKNTEKELKQIENRSYLLAILIVLMLITVFSSRYMSKKTIIKKEDYIELLKEDNSFEKEVIEYLDIDSIKNLLSDINYLKEFQKVIKEKDWLLKRIKKGNKFKDLLNNIHFKEYLSLFDDDYINNYFKEEINKIKEDVIKINEDLEIINKISKENVLKEKESFRIIKM